MPRDTGAIVVYLCSYLNKLWISKHGIFLFLIQRLWYSWVVVEIDVTDRFQKGTPRWRFENSRRNVNINDSVLIVFLVNIRSGVSHDLISFGSSSDLVHHLSCPATKSVGIQISPKTCPLAESFCLRYKRIIWQDLGCRRGKSRSCYKRSPEDRTGQPRFLPFQQCGFFEFRYRVAIDVFNTLDAL